MAKPPPWEWDLDQAVRIHGTAPNNIPVLPKSNSASIPHGSGMFGRGQSTQLTAQAMQSNISVLEREYQARTNQLLQTVEHELEMVRREGTNLYLPSTQAIIRELEIRNKLLARKTEELEQRRVIANKFFGSDPVNKTLMEFYQKASQMEPRVKPYGIAMHAWTDSYRAAHDVRLLSQSIDILHRQNSNYRTWLAASQANDRELARQTAERARIAAEQQRQKALAEKARREQEEARVREQERLAALAEKQRHDAQMAQLAADIARRNAEEEAQERARIATLKAALVEAELKADATAKEFVAEQNRLQAETQARIDAIQQQLETEKRTLEIRRKVIDTATAVTRRQAQLATASIHLQNEKKPGEQPVETVIQLGTEGPGQDPHTPEFHQVYPALGAIASTQPSLSLSSASVRLAPATSKAILAALRAGVATLTAIGTALLSPAVVGFAALVMPSRLGNGERFAMSVPLAELSSVPPQTLREIADRQGTLEMPVGLGVRPLGSGTEVFVSTADNFHIRSSVLVLNAAYDLLNDVYEAVLPDSPTDFLTWTPINSPDNNSTESPMVDTDPPAYSGATIVPIEGRLDLNPILVEGWDRFIIVFPDDSGITPLYVVFSNPYPGATAKGKYSGRFFNPEQAGGPIQDLDWRAGVITQAGIDALKLHISRLDQSDANEIMVHRLEKILGGHLEATDTDLRYYTHEIRELERFRAMGLSDEFKPETGSAVWNNAHTATLEDYRLSSDEHVLYSPDAVRAGNSQLDRLYEQLLKGKN